MRKWLTFNDLYVGQKVMVQSGKDHPCCVICGFQVIDQGDDVHAATVVNLRDNFGSVVIKFDVLRKYIDSVGHTKTVDGWCINPDYISDCLFLNNGLEQQTTCSCDIYYLMNIGCPSASGKVCPNSETGDA